MNKEFIKNFLDDFEAWAKEMGIKLPDGFGNQMEFLADCGGYQLGEHIKPVDESELGCD